MSGSKYSKFSQGKPSVGKFYAPQKKINCACECEHKMYFRHSVVILLLDFRSISLWNLGLNKCIFLIEISIPKRENV